MTYPARIAVRLATVMDRFSWSRLLDRTLRAPASPAQPISWGRLGGGRRGPLRLNPHVHELVDAVNRVVLESVCARAAPEDPPDVLDGHHHSLAHQPLLDALEGLDALRLLQGSLRLLKERVGTVVAPAHRVRARDGRGDEEIEEVGRRIDHGQEARVVLPRPCRGGEGRRLEPLDLEIETHLPQLGLDGRDDALVQLREDVERGLEGLAVFLPHAG